MKSWLVYAVSGLFLGTLTGLLGNAEAATEGVSPEAMTQLWQASALGLLGGIAFRSTREMRRRCSAFGTYASWVITMTVGMSAFFVPEMTNDGWSRTVGLWLLLGFLSGLGIAAFSRWILRTERDGLSTSRTKKRR